ncbi:ABC transporter ATP-binding protein [Oceanicola sp. 502str15]|uniref:ABC transporter ATP-binding protein n=1 Tax=Oceanicola sp. 502str15 TaxID=2696061 RepID=UPI0020962797|nr:ABC transporter ATP-binding protein [Oceanicola sp. 502str15]MCO6381742.1 ATP-binding cassette domain-containing protein [Oceanicola sp. 502str15]
MAEATSGLALEVTGLRKTFRRSDGGMVRAIDDVSLRVGQGDFVVLLGPSGCGKTTLLRAVAGLETPDEGRIAVPRGPLFDSAAGLDLAPERRQVGMVFQSYALWPHMTVARNVAYPMRMRGVAKGERDRRVSEILQKMHIGDLGPSYPSAISGGQQQRVALARALVCGDPLILFDEPLSNVDAKVREHLRLEILTMQREFGFTALYVTHDQEEAMALASHIAVVDAGQVVQYGVPEEIYAQPATLDVARFIGTANELPVEIGEGGALTTPAGQVRVAAPPPGGGGRDAILLSRPEQWRIMPRGAEGLHGRVVSSAFLGPVMEHVVQLETAGPEVLTLLIRGGAVTRFAVGTEVSCLIEPDGPMLFAAEPA